MVETQHLSDYLLNTRIMMAQKYSKKNHKPSSQPDELMENAEKWLKASTNGSGLKK